MNVNPADTFRNAQERRDTIAASTRRVIANYERLNEKLRAAIRSPFMFPFRRTNERYLRFNLERIEANKEWLRYFGYEC